LRVYLHKQKRKAISPVLATVILIAITLIAAIAVAGFVFGLFGSFTSSAKVQVSTSTLAHAITGSILALNTGTSNTNVNSITLTYGGQTCTPTITAPTPATITAGVASGVSLTVAAGGCAAGTAGESYSGMLYLSNGAQVPFTGTFS